MSGANVASPDQETVSEDGTIGGNVLANDQRSSSPSPNLLVNGSFEAGNFVGPRNIAYPGDIPGWTDFGSGTVEMWGTGFLDSYATDGGVLVEIDNSSPQDGLSQTVQTVAGETYKLSFDLGVRRGTGNDDNALEILVNGVSLGIFTPTSAILQTFTLEFVGSGSDVITFREPASVTNGYGTLLDNVRLAGPAPAPVAAVNGDPALVGAAVTGSTGGAFTLRADGSYSFIPGSDFDHLDVGQSAVTSITYTIGTGAAASTTTLTITVTGANDAPRLAAALENAVTAEDTPITGRLLAASDPEGHAISYELAGTAPDGFTLNPDGSWSYAPPVDFHGNVSFQYRASDGSSASAPKTVTITVTPISDYAPVAASEGNSAAGLEDRLVTGQLPAASDADGDALTYELVEPLAGLTLNANGSYSYAPPADFNGEVSFNYRAVDVDGLRSAPQTFTISLAAVDDPVVRVGGELTVNMGASAPLDPTIAGLPGGGFVVAWNTSAEASGVRGGDIRAQIYDVHGNKVGAEFSVNTVTAGQQNQPAISVLESGGFVIAWSSLSSSTNYDIKAQRFAADGSPLGGEFLVNSITASTQDQPDIAALDAGGFAIIWESGTSVINLNARLFDQAATPEGGDLTIAGNAGTSARPSIAALGEGGFVAAWTQASDGSGSGIRAQLFAADGADAGAEFTVNTVTFGTQSAVSVAALSSGGFVVTWTDNSGQGGDSSSSGIKGQLFDAAGTRIGSEFLVNSVTAGSQNAPEVTALRNGGFVVTWTGPDGSANGIRAQVFDASGARVGDELQVNANTANNQVAPTVTAVEGGFVVAWQSPGTINAQMFRLNREPEIADTAIALAEDSSVSGAFAPTDADGDAVAYTLLDGPDHGTLLFNPDGSYSYTPDADYFGADSFIIFADDGLSQSGPATVTLNVASVNDAPAAAAAAETGRGDEDTILSGQLLAGTDVERDALTYVIEGEAPAGLTLAADGRWTYAAPANSNGMVTFAYRVSDGALTSAPKTVTLTVTPVNDAPVARADAVSVYEDGTSENLWSLLLGNDSDIDSASLSIVDAQVVGSANIVQLDTANRSLTFTAADGSLDVLEPGETRNVTFQYTVADGNGGTHVAIVTVTVIGVMEPSNNGAYAGGGASDTLQGSAGVDTMNGKGGDDLLIGGAGADILQGGKGNDIFQMNGVADFGDVIQDMEIGSKYVPGDVFRLNVGVGQIEVGNNDNVIDPGELTIVNDRILSSADIAAAFAAMPAGGGGRLLLALTGEGNKGAATLWYDDPDGIVDPVMVAMFDNIRSIKEMVDFTVSDFHFI